MRESLPVEKLSKHCPKCGATKSWHFMDCLTVPGGELLYTANLEAKYRYEKEKQVPREQGERILRAINLMMASPSHEVMLQRKVAIQVEISKL